MSIGKANKRNTRRIHDKSTPAPSTLKPTPSSSSSSTVSRATVFREVLAAIQTNDVESVRNWAFEPGGFRDPEIRRRAWKFLLGVSKSAPISMSKAPSGVDQRNIMEVDVLRSCFSWDVHESVAKARRTSLRESLLSLMCHFFVRHPQYAYFQGFHELCLVFLECAKTTRQQALPMVEAYSWRLENLFVMGFEHSLFPLLDKLRTIVSCESPALETHFRQLDFQYHFAVSWILTHFAHVLPRIGQVARVFDILIAKDSPMALYFGASLVLKHREALLELTDPCEQHAFWSDKTIFDDINEEEWVRDALTLLERHPPHLLTQRRSSRKWLSEDWYSRKVPAILVTVLVACAAYTAGLSAIQG